MVVGGIETLYRATTAPHMGVQFGLTAIKKQIVCETSSVDLHEIMICLPVDWGGTEWGGQTPG